MPTLQLSTKQMDAFDDTQLQGFRIAMAQHLRESAGDIFSGQTDQQVLDYIDKGITRAKAYKATEIYAFGMFISVMVMLGDDFDTSGKYPWAQDALKDTSIKDPNARMDNLMVQCTAYFDATDSND